MDPRIPHLSQVWAEYPLLSDTYPVFSLFKTRYPTSGQIRIFFIGPYINYIFHLCFWCKQIPFPDILWWRKITICISCWGVYIIFLLHKHQWKTSSCQVLISSIWPPLDIWIRSFQNRINRNLVSSQKFIFSSNTY